jgi:hydroxymethylbilane synthase
MLPAPAQGAVGIECRTGDDAARDLLAAIDDADTACCVGHERGLLAALDADCHSPVAALATVDGGEVRLRAALYAEDGSAVVSGERAGARGDSGFAPALAAALLADAPPAVRRLFGA